MPPRTTAVASARLRLPPASVPSDSALAQALSGQALLLVLDNAEHVVEPLAPLVARLQRELPRLQWLVTSREPLQVRRVQQVHSPAECRVVAQHDASVLGRLRQHELLHELHLCDQSSGCQ